ncbi:MAG: putative molybdenum carrier protein [Pirellulaceae bacterium]|jgi:hypothetical protein|nr:putative molybdenum carrier protein [Pirellulaceae bacterium]
MIVSRIVSGGQTGVDRAALDAAIELGIAHGGWCPAGRRAEDGAIPERYLLRETTATNYSVRTEKNVVDSDATLIIYRGGLHGGTLLTKRLATKLERPCLANDLDDWDADRVFEWLAANAVRTLNIAGPRESSHPGIGAAAHRVLRELLSSR